MRKFLLVTLSLVLLLTACTQYQFIPVPFPVEDVTSPSSPHIVVNEKAGILFKDDFSTDTSAYYNPGLINKEMEDGREKNMVIENGVAKFYGGGAFIQYDSMAGNNPTSGTASGYNHNFNINFDEYNYTLTIEGTISAVEDLEAPFYGFGIATTETQYLEAGLKIVQDEDGTLDIVDYGNQSKVLIDDFTGENVPFKISATYSIDNNKLRVSSLLTIDNQTFALAKQSSSDNPVAKAIYMTAMGPYGNDWADAGAQYATLTSVSLTRMGKATADSLHLNTNPNSNDGVMFNDEFSADSMKFYDVTLINPNLTNVPGNMIYNPETNEADFYGGGMQIQFDNNTSNDPAGLGEDQYKYDFDLENYTYTITATGRIDEITAADITSPGFSVTIATRDEDSSSSNGKSGLEGGFRVIPADDGQLVLKPSWYAAPTEDKTVAFSSPCTFEVKTTISKDDSSDGKYAMNTIVKINGEEEFEYDSNPSKQVENEPFAFFLTIYGPYGEGYSEKGAKFMSLESVNLTADSISTT